MTTKLIPLDNHAIALLAKPLQSKLPSDLLESVDFDFDSSKELRFKNYPIVSLILQNPNISNFVSNAIPNPLHGKM